MDVSVQLFATPWMWELDYKESWVLKNWYFWTVVLEKTLESLLDCKEIQPVHPKGDQSWVFIGRTDVEAETPILWPPDTKSWFTWKDPHLKRLKTGGERDHRGWDGWMASPTQWTWVWVNSGSWWWTGRPGVLQSMGLQRIGHDWVMELNWTEHEAQKPMSYSHSSKTNQNVFSIYLWHWSFNFTPSSLLTYHLCHQSHLRCPHVHIFTYLMPLLDLYKVNLWVYRSQLWPLGEFPFSNGLYCARVHL